MNTYVRFIVAGEINLPKKKNIGVQHLIFLFFLQWKLLQQYTKKALLRFHRNSCYWKAPAILRYSYITYLVYSVYVKCYICAHLGFYET